MTSQNFDNWEAGEFAAHFRRAAHCAPGEYFTERFNALADEVEPLEREFCLETASCGNEMGDTLAELAGIAASMKGCYRAESGDAECRPLFEQVDHAISHVRSMRGSCFL